MCLSLTLLLLPTVNLWLVFPVLAPSTSNALWGRCRLPYPHIEGDAALQNTVNVMHLFVRAAFASADYSECLLGTNACVALLPVLD